MDESFSHWRKADRSDSVISESDDEVSTTSNNDERKTIIEESDTEDDTNDFQNLSARKDDDRYGIYKSLENVDKIKQTDHDISVTDVTVDLDDTYLSPVQPAVQRRNRKIYDDSDVSLADQLDEQDLSSTNHSDKHDEEKKSSTNASGTDNISESTDGSYVDDVAGLDVTNDRESCADPADKAAVSSTPGVPQKINTGSNKENTTFQIISDDSDSDDTSDGSHPNHLRDHASGHGTSSLRSTLTLEDEAIIMPFVRQEIGVGNINPMVEQQRAILTCNIQQVKTQLAKSKMLLHTANIALLPDKGEKLRHSINVHEAELQKLSEQLECLPKLRSPRPDANPSRITHPIIRPPWKVLANPDHIKGLGKIALATHERQQALTEERLKDLHGSLNARPGEDEHAPDPRGLKVTLMPHQQHALAWLLWREKQKPHGGILADDMGLGKTLTMISLIMATREEEDSDDGENSDDEWVHRKKSNYPKGGTLVVCPASVLSQWDAEIRNRVKRGLLSVELYHGTQRETVAKRLAKNDVVITTYNLISRVYNKDNSNSILHKIRWQRVILDEAHIVRNHKSQASESVCNIYARSRWALTGTPIQNKEMDLYALLKFLKCSPFDDLRVWKRWVDNKNAHGHERLATVMKTLMLRRTKVELQGKGGLSTLPDKNLEEIEIKLDPEEQLVYEKVLVFSRTLFAQFLHQRADRNHTNELNSGKFDAPTFLQRPKDTQFTNAQNQLLARHADIKAHEILVLLLRLRQICCQPSLIHTMLDREDLQGNDIIDEKGLNVDVINGIGALNLEDNENIDPNEIGVDRRVVENLLTSKNPVFNPTRQSSKMRAVLETLQKIIQNGDKVVVVSQWTSMLEVVRSQLESLDGVTYDILAGNVPVKNRQNIVESFNKPTSAPQILLLSLTAGGVGLNLVGGNHLLLLDIHWNPQLEAQAQDRIYRVGQKKSVYIYKFMCLDTVEQRIKALQERKLAIAHGVLTGAGTAGAGKLTLDDLKSLFSF